MVIIKETDVLDSETEMGSASRIKPDSVRGISSSVHVHIHSVVSKFFHVAPTPIENRREVLVSFFGDVIVLRVITCTGEKVACT